MGRTTIDILLNTIHAMLEADLKARRAWVSRFERDIAVEKAEILATLDRLAQVETEVDKRNAKPARKAGGK